MLTSQPTPSGGDLNRLRQINERAVLDIVRASGPVRAAEIAATAGLARASVVDVLRTLEAKGWVAVEEPVIAGRGRPAVRYRFRSEAGQVVGVDIGAHTIRVTVVDLAGTVLGTAVRAVTPELTRRRRINAVLRAVEDCLESAGTTRDEIWVSFAGSTGRIDAPGRVLAASAIPDWAGLDLQAALAEKLPGRRILVENDVRLATIAELRLGVARDVRDLILIQAGRRTALGIVLEGNLRTGFGNVAGDLSPYNALSLDDAYCYIEDCTSVSQAGPTSDHAADVLAAAKEGDRSAISAVNRYTRAIATVASMAVSLLDPELVVLGGLLAQRPELVLPVFEEALGTRCMRVPRIQVSQFRQEAVALGAACRGLDAVGDALLGDNQASLPPLRAPES